MTEAVADAAETLIQETELSQRGECQPVGLCPCGSLERLKPSGKRRRAGGESRLSQRERLMQPVSWDRAFWVGKDVSVDLWARRGTIWAERTPPKVVPHRSNSGRGGAQNQETHFAAGQRRLLTGLCFFDRSAPDRNTVATG